MTSAEVAIICQYIYIYMYVYNIYIYKREKERERENVYILVPFLEKSRTRGYTSLLQIPSETSDHIGESIIIGELRGFPLESKYFFVDKETLSTSKNQLSFHSLSTFWETCIPINERGSFSTHPCPNDQPVGLRDT